MNAPVVLFHGNCPDGFGAAWWLGKHLTDPELVACSYGMTPPDVTGRDVFMVDFCFPAREMTQIAAQCKTLLVLDHHQSAAEYVRDAAGIETYADLFTYMEYAELGGGSTREAVIDQKRSGVGLVSVFVKRRSGENAPEWFANIEDRDLWRFNIPDTAAVFAAVTSRPYTPEAWDEMADMELHDLVAEGNAIERYRQQLIAQCLDNAHHHTFVSPDQQLVARDVWVANCPYAICSDVAGELAKRDPTRFAATYFDIDESHRKWSLRSADTGSDVAVLAAHWPPGGGHKHAAGFMEEQIS